MAAIATATGHEIPDSPDDAAKKSRFRPSRRTTIVSLVLLAALGGGGAFAMTRGHESTDDAAVDADVVAVPARVGGTVKALHFAENQNVKTGDLLAEIDDDTEIAKLAQADATLAATQASADAADADARATRENATGGKAQADASLVTASASAVSAQDQIVEADAQVRAANASLAQATLDRDRAARLRATDAVPQTSLDQSETALSVARANLDAASARLVTLKSNVAQAKSRVTEASARATQVRDVDTLIAQADARAKAAHAQVATAKAARDLAALDLSYTKIYAPHDGVVSKKAINEGQNVTPGQAIVQLVTPAIWVTANFKETQLEKMHPGQPATFTVDSFPQAEMKGEIESFSGATGSKFTLLPPDNASGNFTKIVQRVPVRIHISNVPSGVVLRPGMSVDVTVNTRG